MRRLATQSLAGALALTATLAWLFLAPPALGGSTTYVVTDGISMLPRFHGGDLALVRAESSYRVGEIVAYRSRMLDTIVLHRIVAVKGGRYFFKGDNNNFVDVEHPTRSQLVGALWLHIPGLGARLAPLRSPLAMGALVAAAVLFLGGGAFHRRRRRGRRRGGDAPAAGPHTTDWRSGFLTAGGACLLPFAALAIISFGRPATGPVPVDVSYRQTGSYSYAAKAVAGTAYPDGRATTGQPLFLRLIDEVRVGFEYRFGSAEAHAVRGTASLAAKVSSSTGWTRTLPLERATPFTGDRVVLHGTLQLRTLPPLLQQLESATDVRGSYTLALVPHIRVHGTAGGLALEAVFSTPLSFSLDPLELQPLLASAPATPGAPARPSPLTPSSSASVTGSRPGPLTLSAAGMAVRVSLARRISVLGLAAAALCALIGLPAGIGRLRRRDGEAERIKSRYARFLVPVSHLEEASAQRVVEVADMDALVKIAERYERMILHERERGEDTFSVSDDGVVYRYVVDESRARTAPAQTATTREAII
ncbi:MAG TPA: signal peptidase I [Gaiellaceae bacterium]|nr:signal peptidase I [Gaiellaceae bacterium]